MAEGWVCPVCNQVWSPTFMGPCAHAGAASTEAPPAPQIQSPVATVAELEPVPIRGEPNRDDALLPLDQRDLFGQLPTLDAGIVENLNAAFMPKAVSKALADKIAGDERPLEDIAREAHDALQSMYAATAPKEEAE